MKYIVEFDNSLTREQRISIVEECGAEYIGNIFNNFELVNCPSEEAVNLLSSNSDVITVELNGYGEKNGIEPADFPMQLINVVGNAHDKEYKGDGVVVAIIDSGLNYDHEDLQFPIYKCAKILNNSVVSVDVIEDVKDDNGHGTAVASVIAMQDNEIGYLGIAPNVQMMIIKANDESTSSMSYTSMVKSITWAVDNGAKVINISYSQNVHNTAVNAACQYAYENNVSVVASAGNTGDSRTFSGGLTSTENVNFWKEYPGVIVVGSVMRRNNYGGKILPNLLVSYNHYQYSLIYYNESSNRYRLLMSDYPITIETGTGNGFRLFLKGFNEYHDFFPLESSSWGITVARKSTDQIINFSAPLSADSPFIVYSNHDIVNNKDGGIVHKTPIDMDVFREHVVSNYGQTLQVYNETDLTNILKAAYSSFGQGIDFVAPGYFNLAEEDVNNAYRYGKGTSYSAPFVAGIIAILRQRFPNLTIDNLYNLMKENAITVDHGDPNYYGIGLATMPDLDLNLATKFYHKGKEIKFAGFLTFV